ncbi:head-tail adaptor protein [Streptomyces sp. NPDC102274]|uniref:phage head completion protein n=1 Tax=Streptomyces sp. NPDC102274 TaxID=3366151 RepID=UPI003802AAEC
MSRIGRYLNRTVEVWRVVLADDGGGGQDQMWVHESTQHGRRSQPTARERQAADQAEARLDYTWYFDTRADVRRGDELREPGMVHAVFAVFEPSGPGTYLRADCTTRQPTNTN